ncbi:MAG: AbrB/MazE/SpoVT family DNA-binding domain-containing protein [Candidatus Aenigmatarchaeota archaeon]|nr:MAG: AbrB/MazE/SpoVT family DNA-binding domain-containing protein [Candidatus Aenigmarchaeota archaeon]
MEIKFKDIDCMDESSVTIRKYRRRTTVPSKVFDKLKLRDKDKLKWIVLKDGRVIVEKV